MVHPRDLTGNTEEEEEEEIEDEDMVPISIAGMKKMAEKFVCNVQI